MDLALIGLAFIAGIAACFLVRKYLPGTAAGKEIATVEKDWSTWFHNEWDKAKAEEAALAAQAKAAEPALAQGLATGLADAETVVNDAVDQVKSIAESGLGATIEKDIATQLQELIAKLADTSVEDHAIAVANAQAATDVAAAQAQAKLVVDANIAAKAQKATLLAAHKAAVAAIK